MSFEQERLTTIPNRFHSVFDDFLEQLFILKDLNAFHSVHSDDKLIKRFNLC